MPVSRNSPNLFVYINGAQNQAARVISVRHAAGGENLPEAKFELLTLKNNARDILRMGMGLSTFQNATCVIDCQFNMPGVGVGRKRLHVGRIVGQNISFNEGRESIVYTSRLSKHMFGTTFTYKMEGAGATRNPAAINFLITPAPVVLNPIIDGVSRPNRYTSGFPVSPDAIWRKADRYDYWTLAEAVRFVCLMCNDAAIYVKNPTAAELAHLDSTPLIDHEISDHKYLPELLDELLIPRGYMWSVDFNLPGRGPTIVVYPRVLGRGETNLVRLQAPGATINYEDSNVADLNLNYDITDRSVSKVVVLGDYRTIEHTFYLSPGWDPVHDDASYDDLFLHSEAMLTTEGLDRAWRVWVLNESGEYTGLRPGLTDYRLGIVTTPETTQLLKRRRFLPMLTQNADNLEPFGRHDGGTFIQWRHTSDEDADGNEVWRDVETSDVRLLNHECGIMFTGEHPPVMKVAGGSNPDTIQIKITACVQLDERIRGEAVAAPGFRNTVDEVLAVVDMADRYKWRERIAGSYFDTHAPDLPTSERVDGDIATFAGNLLGAWVRGTLGGSISLFGIDWATDYLGYHIKTIQPWGFSLQTGTPGNAYPIIVGVDYDIDSQTTALTLETYQPEVFS